MGGTPQNSMWEVDKPKQAQSLWEVETPAPPPGHESKLSRFGKQFAAGSGASLLAPPEGAVEQGISLGGGPAALAVERTGKGLVDLIRQTPEALRYWSERIPGARGIYPARPVGQTLSELSSIAPGIAGITTG